MPIIPQKPFQEMTEKELYFRARYHYEQEPSAENLVILNQASACLPQGFEKEHAIWKAIEREEIPCSKEAHWFAPGTHIALIPHLRYSPIMWHSHDFFELIYVYQGSCTHYIGQRSFEMREGQLCILPPNMQHAVFTARDDSQIINILIRKSTFTEVFTQLLSPFDLLSEFFQYTLYQKANHAYLLFYCGQDSKINETISAMFDEYRSQKHYSATVLIGYLTLLFGTLLRDHKDNVLQYLPQKKDEFVNVAQMLSYIQKNIQTVTLQHVAQEFSYSVSRCSILIKEATGSNFKDIVRDQKVKLAAKYLAETALPLTEIMAMAGYHEPSHFYKCFRNQFQMTPIEYRRRITA